MRNQSGYIQFALCMYIYIFASTSIDVHIACTWDKCCAAYRLLCSMKCIDQHHCVVSVPDDVV